MCTFIVKMFGKKLCFCGNLQRLKFTWAINHYIHCRVLWQISYFVQFISTELNSFVLFRSVLFCSVPFRSVLFCSVLLCSILLCSALFRSAMFCSVLICSVMFCSVLTVYVLQVSPKKKGPTSLIGRLTHKLLGHRAARCIDLGSGTPLC